MLAQNAVPLFELHGLGIRQALFPKLASVISVSADGGSVDPPAHRLHFCGNATRNQSTNGLNTPGQ